ncbi:MAG: carbonic anhydrase [Polyangiaceae bacterium]
MGKAKPRSDGLQYDHEHPDALALYCSDGRFTNAVAELLRSLGYPRLDTMTIPGGPALLEMGSAGLMEVDVIRKSTSFLITAHRIEHVTLLAHQGCGYYRSQFAYEDAAAIFERQLGDLRAGANYLRAVHPRVEVACYFARPEGGFVEFDRIE